MTVTWPDLGIPGRHASPHGWPVRSCRRMRFVPPVQPTECLVLEKWDKGGQWNAKLPLCPPLTRI